ncbi:sigma-70 family RNA polymerase sigma factor [Nocardioides plantarum]|uniref:Sigma-70 family RNA polymerase sigma factor n=1 Tax=Nocardioides plantarum TaxID=29299 RepID=A0ABV5K8H9_9ACTN|nr:sigma-70 family RNA polymerase sigma factor [Nocardioides plantarum]
MTVGADGEGDASDVELTARARMSDTAAVAVLFERHHDAALRLARGLTDPVTAEDIAAEAFARVLRSLREGRGPHEAFRPYLLRAVRNVHVDHVRNDRRYVWEDEPTDRETAPAADVPLETSDEARLVARAFDSLPERWQTVLWHTVVENDDHATVGRLLGIKANAVAALAFRARDGLREAYLTAHLGQLPAGCQPTRGSLAAFARGGLHGRRERVVQAHLAECSTCTAAIDDLRRISRGTGLLLGPGVLGVAGAAYVTAAYEGSGVLPAEAELASGRRRDRRHLLVAVAVAAALVLVAGSVQALVGRESGRDDRESSAPGGGASPGTAQTSAPSIEIPTSQPPSPHGTPSAPSTASPVTPPDSPTPLPSSPLTATTPPIVPVVPPDLTPTPIDPSVMPPIGEPVTPLPPSSSTPRADLWLANARSEDLVDFQHFEVGVGNGALSKVRVELRLAGVDSWTLHSGPSWAVASCREPAPARVVCEVLSTRGPLGFDLVAGDGFRVDAVVSAPGNKDPRPGNDALSFRG